MKTLRGIFIALIAAALGFSLGKIGGETQPVAPQSKAAGSSRATAASPSDAADEAVSRVLGALLDHGNFRELARLGTLLDALDSTQMRALLARIERLPPSEYEVLLPRLLANWMKRDPQAATEWMQPRLALYAKEPGFAGGFATFDTDLANTWAKNAPELAVEYARQHFGTGLARTILHNAIFAWPDKDCAHRFEVLRSFPAGKDRKKAAQKRFRPFLPAHRRRTRRIVQFAIGGKASRESIGIHRADRGRISLNGLVINSHHETCYAIPRPLWGYGQRGTCPPRDLPSRYSANRQPLC